MVLKPPRDAAEILPEILLFRFIKNNNLKLHKKNKRKVNRT